MASQQKLWEILNIDINESDQPSNPDNCSYDLKLNPDGSFTRFDDPHVPPTGDQLPPGSSDLALSKDVPLNKSHNTFIRIFKPITTTTSSSSSTISKLPVILYFHGGGFNSLSAASAAFHDICTHMSAELPAIILSVDYRLAPENRLPAAYDDAVDAILWVRDQAREPTETWLDRADFSNCFLMGNSSGGSIVFHSAVRAMELDLNPVELSGLILDQMASGGQERTESELRMANDKGLPLALTDFIYKLALPEGADRDHEYCNLMKMRGKVKGFPKCFVNGYLRDPLIDRQRMLADMLEEEGVTVARRLDQEGFHGVTMVDSDLQAIFVDDVKKFIYQQSQM